MSTHLGASRTGWCRSSCSNAHRTHCRGRHPDEPQNEVIRAIFLDGSPHFLHRLRSLTSLASPTGSIESNPTGSGSACPLPGLLLPLFRNLPPPLPSLFRSPPPPLPQLFSSPLFRRPSPSDPPDLRGLPVATCIAIGFQTDSRHAGAGENTAAKCRARAGEGECTVAGAPSQTGHRTRRLSPRRKTAGFSTGGGTAIPTAVFQAFSANRRSNRLRAAQSAQIIARLVVVARLIDGQRGETGKAGFLGLKQCISCLKCCLSLRCCRF